MSRVATIINRPDGLVTGVNVDRLNEMPFHLVPNQPNTAITVPANSSSSPTIASISGEGPAQITHLAANRTNASLLVLLQIQDGQNMRALMNRACHVDTIFGNYNPGSRAYPLPEALYIDEQRGLVITATDKSGSTNSFRPDFISSRFLTRTADPNLDKARARMEQRQYLSLPSFLTLDNGFTAVPGSGTTSEPMTVGQDAHFEMFQITAVATSPLFDFNIINADTGEALIEAPLSQTYGISGNLITGSAGFPFRFPEPRFCELRSKYIVQFTDRSGSTNTIFFTIGGRSLADRMWV